MDQATIHAILTYWFPNEKFNAFWFDSTPDEYIKQNYKNLVDNLGDNLADIVDQQYFSTMTNDELLVLLIIFDQFTRNIYRKTNSVMIEKNDKIALSIAEFFVNEKRHFQFSANKFVFTLLPFRHNRTSPNYVDKLDVVRQKINEYRNTFGNCDILDRFMIATLKNYTEIIAHGIVIDINNISDSKNDINLLEKYSHNILDPVCYDTSTVNKNDAMIKISNKQLITTIKNVLQKLYPNGEHKKIIIGTSLSGGVDSMVLTYILKQLEKERFIKQVVSVHIYYGNRSDSMDETNFIRDWCKMENVPLIIKFIDYMKRPNNSSDLTSDDDSDTKWPIDRTFYEEETRKIRFNTYEYVNDHFGSVSFCLGHHRDDLAENVFMNILKGRNILDLYVMSEMNIINNVTILRPMLSHLKKDILAFAESYKIPYTKDTTPDWSCRGVMRRKVFPLIESQFGDYTTNVINLGQKSLELSNYIDKKINSIGDNCIRGGHTGFVVNNIFMLHDESEVFWTRFLMRLIHKMNTNMIKIKTIKPFIEWFNSKSSNMFKFSNELIGIINDDKFYIFKPFTTSNWNVRMVPIDHIVTDKNDMSNIEVRTKFTYDDVINGEFSYTEKFISSHPIDRFDDYSKMSKQDTTRKLFSMIPEFHNNIPKYSSGVFKPSNDDVIHTMKITIYFDWLH
ncbi:MAG: putative tRNA(Ile)lysidine synthase [Terrestrivirus sp.]|uniref:tRNA(Ile)-lysidine synthetase n=1 Tax=Terrestrivirus sp. TaxID=2487775 RepID=A0A3G4ZL87_9VIRU|nr:MAG: putative tRNA(Ile)lysidine synthase [Terrestrivirus sp.]